MTTPAGDDLAASVTRLTDEFPDFDVHRVRVYRGDSIQACLKDGSAGDGVYVIIGSPDEVRAELSGPGRKKSRERKKK